MVSSPRGRAAAVLIIGALPALVAACGSGSGRGHASARDCGGATLAAARKSDTAALIKVLAPVCGRARLARGTSCATASLPSRPTPGTVGKGPAPGQAFVRVNQVGYVPQCPKTALLVSRTALPHAAFRVARAGGRDVLTGAAGPSRGRWSARWPHVYELDFGSLTAPGRYVIQVGSVRSPEFTVGNPGGMYGPLAADALSFFQSQRDGPNVIPGPLGRKPSHLRDQHATVYAPPRYRGTTLAGPLRQIGGPVDVAGGWFDAGDYLKFVDTASFSEILMLMSLRDYADAIPHASALAQEAKFGLDWLRKMWNPGTGVLFYQVGIGDGNGHSVLGDHDLWRLPETDDKRPDPKGSRTFYVGHRPVFAANKSGRPISPNLAGRLAAAFALCSQVFSSSDPPYAHRCLQDAQDIFDRAGTKWRGPLVTSTPNAYYTQPEWRDDMELAAAELYIATLADHGPGLRHTDAYYYVEPAATWANAYITNLRNQGLSDSLNLRDVSGLAHYELYRIMEATGNTHNLQTDASQLLTDLSDQLTSGARVARRDPFRLADADEPADTVSHALGYAIEARLYDQLIGRPRFEALAANQLDWALGQNPWGSSFVTGAGTAFPTCLSHQVANLRGALRPDGGPILKGAVVNGPNAAGAITLGAPDGYRPCPAGGRNPYRAFDARGFAYRDDVRSPTTSEPADDAAALGMLAFAQRAAVR
jgi:endoglucanase